MSNPIEEWAAELHASRPYVPRPEYLGDGVYVSCDGFGIRIVTSNGLRITNEIALEPKVFRALVKYEEKVRLR